MPFQLSGYESNLDRKDNTEITMTNVGSKGLLDTLGVLVPLAKRWESNTSGQPIYTGYAAPGSLESSAVWLIVKTDYSDDIPTKEDFANGEFKFDKIWNNRTTYTYFI